MQITASSLAMQTSHVWLQQSSVQENLKAWVSAPAPNGQSAPPLVNISSAAQDLLAQKTAATDTSTTSTNLDPWLQLVIQMIEKMTGQKIQIFDASQILAPQASQTTQVSALTTAAKSVTPAGVRSGMDYSQVSRYSESEQSTFQASGTIKTSDGQEITFKLSVLMQRQFSQTSSTSVHIGDSDQKTDPLVINFNGNATQLSDQRFSFDLNSTGNNVNINAPLSGSGFIALDKNGDGKINNGSELFGPSTSNGFAELAKYDSNHNGWIDGSDAAFNQLKVWSKNADGSDQLSSLASLGIGAISLQAVSTPFEIKTASNQLLGSVRSSSVALNENGTAGVVQQIDLTT